MSLLLERSGRWTAWNKPGGIPVFPPHADPEGDCLLRRSGLAAENWDDAFAGGIAHRLDTPTSGQVLSANSAADLVWLRELFASGHLTKVYRFVSAASVPWDTNSIDRSIAHDRRKRGRMVVRRGKSTPHRGRWMDAQTRFQRLGRTADGAHVWEAVMHSGVMHQIRVHAAFLGIPLRGDRRYGGGMPSHESVPFLLHHVGLSGPDLEPPKAPLPIHWPG